MPKSLGFSKKNNFNITAISHIGVWLLYYGVLLLILYVNSPKFFLWTMLMSYSLSISLFYTFAYFLLPKYHQSSKIGWLFFLILISWCIYIGLNYFIDGFLKVRIYNSPIIPFTFKNYILPVSWTFFQFGVFGTVFHRKLISIEKERQMREIQEKLYESEKGAMEKRKLELELALIRARMNPHFVHNSLHAIYATVSQVDGKIAEPIAILGQMMHYAYRPPEPDGKSALIEEDEQIRRLIKINQFRNKDTLFIDYQVEGSLLGFRIIPYLLVTLAENAIKHGLLTDKENPVIINLKVKDNIIYFDIFNRKRDGPEEFGNGIGMTMINELLQMEYIGKHHFTFKEENGNFFCTLTIIV
jgi:two-component system, LytTR family, sensor kinase